MAHPAVARRGSSGWAAFVSMPSVEAKHAYRFGYLKSEHWSNLRLAKLVEQKARCQVCKLQDVSNDVHHVLYRKSLYDTVLDDLVVLCRKHHEAVHKVLEENADINDCKTARVRWSVTFERLRDFSAMWTYPEKLREKNSHARWVRVAQVPTRFTDWGMGKLRKREKGFSKQRPILTTAPYPPPNIKTPQFAGCPNSLKTRKERNDWAKQQRLVKEAAKAS